jgi:hypothetical protein
MRQHLPEIRLRNDIGWLMSRDGIVLCFFMRRSFGDVASAVWGALQSYLRAIPPQSLAWYGGPEGDTLPLGEKGWGYIRTRMLERPMAHACLVDLRECESGQGAYNFEYEGIRLDSPLVRGRAGATSGMAFSFPTEYLMEHGPAHLRALALEIARELPFSFGYASFALVSPRGGWYAARKQLPDLLGRYYGLDFYQLRHTSELIGTGARGAYWLTFLGQPLLGQLGGEERLRQALAFPGVSFQPMEGDRLLLTLGEWPDAIDTSLEPDVPQYCALARMLEPYFPAESMGWTELAKEKMYYWLRRFCL